MESRVKTLLSEVEFTYLKLKTLYQEIGEATREGKRGKAQQLIHTRQYLYKKLYNLREKFNHILKGSVCYINYEYETGNLKKSSNATLVNVSDEEIEEIIKLYCRFHGYKFLKILDIQRIHTKFG